MKNDLKKKYQEKLKLLKKGYEEDFLENPSEFLKENHQKKLKLLKEYYQEVDRKIKKYEHKIYIEKSVSDWFFGDAKNDFGYAIWDICDKSYPSTNWNRECIELMLKRGGNINHVCNGKTPLDLYISQLNYSYYSKYYMSTIEYGETMELLRKNIEILRKLGALTKEELDKLKSNN